EPMGLDDLLAQSDIVSLHAAVTDDSRGLLGAAELARMKKGALLVNSARAALVDEAALAEALKSGHLGGAALDVFRQEPPASDHPLLRLPNVVGTPHIAGNTAEVAAHQGDSVATALEQLLRGELPDTLLNPTTLPAFRWTGERRTPSATEREALAQGSGPAISDLEAEEDAEAGPAPEAPRAPEPVSPATATAASPASRASPAAPAAAKKGFFERLFGGGRSEAQAAPAAQAPAPVAAVPSASPVPAGAGSARVQAARAKMEAILRDFLVRVDADPSIRGFAKGKAVTALYLIPDIDLSFHMAFEGDVPRSAMGRPAGKAQVSMKMNAEVLDAVFMERIGGMKAAMSGQLAFAGNTMKAMSLQRIQKDLCRLYAEARAAIGDPGDLTGLAAATAEAAAPATAAAPGATGQPQVVVAAPAVIRRTGDERDELVAAVEELFAAKLLTSTGGNVSVRRASKPDEIWITPSALPKGALSPELMVRINLEGEPLDEDAGAPSSERLMHARIMARRPDVNAVIHSHGTQTFLLGVTGLPFLPICTESAFLGDP
ncbi:MAG: class II aldolase/adducin family protein, partial [Gemmatimonadetes bacterium]|nr:class II aldolase/adducin family protein [Gemmatimonadota bacterium]